MGGGDASRNGAELFEIEADFSAKIVTFRLVGGMHPPHLPPKSATGGARSRNAPPIDVVPGQKRTYGNPTMNKKINHNGYAFYKNHSIQPFNVMN